MSTKVTARFEDGNTYKFFASSERDVKELLNLKKRAKENNVSLDILYEDVEPEAESAFLVGMALGSAVTAITILCVWAIS